MVTRRSPRVGKLADWVQDPELLQALGEVTVAYAHLTTELQLGIQRLLLTRLDDVGGLIITAGMNFKALTDTYFSLLRVRDSTLVETAEVKDVQSDIEAVNAERNVVMHARWNPGEKPGTARRVRISARAKRGFGFEQTEIPAQELRDLATITRELVANLSVLTDRALGEGATHKR